MSRKFTISDIHGCAETFRALLHRIELSQDDELYLLGDYIDRGPSSRAVVDHILMLHDAGFTVRCLRGNHEQLMLESFSEKEKYRIWISNGGMETLYSFGIEYPWELPRKYVDFFDELPCFLEVDEYILVHAGLNFRQGNPLVDEVAMLWIRDWHQNIDRQWLGERLIIHGHTPTLQSAIPRQLKLLSENRVLNIDAGCVFRGLRPGMGHLCAFELTQQTLFFQPCIDR